MKRYRKLALVLAGIILSLTFIPSLASQTTSAMKADFEAAVMSLKRYLADENYRYGEGYSALDRMREVFEQNYEPALCSGFIHYVGILKILAHEDYQGNTELDEHLKLMRRNKDFCSYLESESASLGTIDTITSYVDGRECEYQGDFETAAACYLDAAGYLDADSRYSSVYLDADLKKYNRALELEKGGEYIRAYFLMQEISRHLTGWQEKVTDLIAEIGYVPESLDDVLEAPADLTIKDGYREITLSWKAAKHAAQYKVYYKESLQPDSSWKLAAQTSGLTAKVSDLQSVTYYDYRVVAVSGKMENSTQLLSQRKSPALKKGQTVNFGRFEQDNYSGPDPIVWECVSVDENQNRAVLVSCYLLECIPYNNTQSPVSWGNSYMRNWLNDTFYSQAFTGTEKAAIMETHNSGSKDYVFILDESQVNSYLGGPKACEATPYVLAKGNIYVDNVTSKAGDSYYNKSSWWVRTDQTGAQARMIRTRGSFGWEDVTLCGKGRNDWGYYVGQGNGVRPAIVIALDQFQLE